jgi:O-antigen/teichoic acid export membrane protein
VYDALTTFLIRVGGAAIAFALQALLARLMTANDYGQYVLVWTWVLSLGSFAALGLAESAVRFLPRYIARDRAADTLGFFQFGTGTIGVVSSLFALAAIVADHWLPISTENQQVVLFVAMALPFLAVEYFLDGIARAMGWFKMTAMTIYIARPVTIGLAILALYGIGTQLDAQITNTVLVLALAATAAALYLAVRHSLWNNNDLTPRMTLQKLWLRSSLPMLIVATLDDLLMYGDVVLVGLLLSPADAAVYFVAGRVLALAAFAQYALYFVYGRVFSLAVAGGNKTLLRREFLRSTSATVATTLAAVGLTIIMAPYLLMLFGKEYPHAAEFVWLLGLGFLARGIGGQAHELLMIAGNQMELVATNAVAILIGIGLITILAESWGLPGAALGAALALVIRSIALVSLVLSNTKVANPT